MRSSIGVTTTLLALSISSCARTVRPTDARHQPLVDRCEQDNADACWEIISRMSGNDGFDEDPEIALALAQKACALGHAAACREACWRLMVTPSQPELAIPYCEKGCKGDHPWNALACADWSRALMAVRMDAHRASKPTDEEIFAIRRACELGDACSCDKSANTWIGSNDFVAEAQALYACWGCGTGGGCTSLSHIYRKRVADPYYLDQARYLDRRACDQGDGLSCLNLGEHWKDRNSTIAGAYFALACERGWTSACLERSFGVLKLPKSDLGSVPEVDYFRPHRILPKPGRPRALLPVVYEKTWAPGETFNRPFANSGHSFYYTQQGTAVTESYHDDAIWHWIPDAAPAIHTNDFLLELEVTQRWDYSDRFSTAGVVWGMATDHLNDAQFLWIDTQGRWAHTRQDNGAFSAPVDWTPSAAINKGKSRNRLGVLRIGDVYTFEINGQKVGEAKVGAVAGPRIGVAVGGRSSVEVNLLRLTDLQSARPVQAARPRPLAPKHALVAWKPCNVRLAKGEYITALATDVAGNRVLARILLGEEQEKEKFWFSSDGGKTFKQVIGSSPRFESPEDASLLVTPKALLAVVDGVLLRSIDEGKTWTKVKGVRVVGAVSLWQVDGVVYFSSNGKLHASTDDGASFNPVPLPEGWLEGVAPGAKTVWITMWSQDRKSKTVYRRTADGWRAEPPGSDAMFEHRGATSFKLVRSAGTDLESEYDVSISSDDGSTWSEPQRLKTSSLLQMVAQGSAGLLIIDSGHGWFRGPKDEAWQYASVPADCGRVEALVAVTDGFLLSCVGEQDAGKLLHWAPPGPRP